MRLPTTVLLAGAGLAGLAGYLLGQAGAPGTEALTTAVVQSYDASTDRLCLTGEAVRAEGTGAVEGRLCGRWGRVDDAPPPRVGERFRFVVVRGAGGGGAAGEVRLFGTPVD